MLDFAFSPRATADLTDVHVSFGDQAALAGVDVSITSGSVTVITGPNGAGKSTLLEVLGGTRAMTSGIRRVRGAVAFVPQRAAIPDGLPVSVRDVVSVGAWGRLGLWRRMDAAARELVETSMDRLEILSLAREPFSSLSGGQQQRTLLAQGLARDADLLLLDEPTTGLDASSALRIRAVLREEAARGVAVVCVSHDPAVIGDAEHTIPLVEGRVGEIASAG
ncbi:zinc ABC transporter ATP-binding protein AztA [Microbacterium sp. Leaf320]|uniref:zinc ABC transporter ATP-binding protein AztA n=1 Tax=Microbacterium sp. Leaf320 TaxID=1736334 RepID=UPI0006F2B1FC|nr:zinc ABC transporter ATP-binding protein AztA [Microbacterium sp. Leaf320]KQQ66238.1 ABC transporter ATP-binding protein [Microbacterium sp. Leaf320]